jgi:hypothetical protein
MIQKIPPFQEMEALTVDSWRTDPVSNMSSITMRGSNVPIANKQFFRIVAPKVLADKRRVFLPCLSLPRSVDLVNYFITEAQLKMIIEDPVATLLFLRMAHWHSQNVDVDVMNITGEQQSNIDAALETTVVPNNFCMVIEPCRTPATSLPCCGSSSGAIVPMLSAVAGKPNVTTTDPVLSKTVSETEKDMQHVHKIRLVLLIAGLLCISIALVIVFFGLALTYGA